MEDEFIERKICIGAISSTEYLTGITSIWNPVLIESATARMLCLWSKEYFDQYEKAPGRDIEGIYSSKLKTGLQKEHAEWIEDVLESLSDESVQEPINASYLIDQTRIYFKERSLRILSDDIQFELDKGQISNAEDLLSQYSPIQTTECNYLDPFGLEAKEVVKSAFAEREQPLIKFPKAFGAFWNRELVRGGFVALMGSEKKGKSMLLVELAMKALKAGSHVAFFQAGDMTESQQLRRIAIYLTERSNEERYCRGQWIPEPDCLLHQLDTCDKNCREGNARLFKNEKEINFESLSTIARANPEHIPCYNCTNDRKGASWLKWREGKQPLTWTQAYRALRTFGKKQSSKFRISTHANGTLSVQGIKGVLSQWQKQDGFIPDVVIIDYADLLVSDVSRLDFRHQQNNIWQQLRNLSQERNALVLTVTQIAARGYGKDLLSMDDFSEDKRKMAHVTACYGLNQTPDEKRIGIMRINPIVIRESDFDTHKPVTILQRLQIGRPFLGSWW
jgi:hypothetical protein